MARSVKIMMISCPLKMISIWATKSYHHMLNKNRLLFNHLQLFIRIQDNHLLDRTLDLMCLRSMEVHKIMAATQIFLKNLKLLLPQNQKLPTSLGNKMLKKERKVVKAVMEKKSQKLS